MTVPAKCWEVILVVENGTATAMDIAKVGSTTRTIAIIMPYIQVIGHDWPKYRVSVKDVETLTGYTFFGFREGYFCLTLGSEVSTATRRATVRELLLTSLASATSGYEIRQQSCA